MIERFGGYSQVGLKLMSNAGGNYRGAITTRTNAGSEIETMSFGVDQNIGNVGIGTATPVSKLSVNGGVSIGTSASNSAYFNNGAPGGGLIVQNNVGIGTFNPFGGGLIVLPANTGNVGIGSLVPGQALDVIGTIRTTNFTMTGQTPVSGYVLMATDTSGDATWSTAGSVSGWTSTNTTDVYETNSGNVGIGTTTTNRAALTVMNGNVGIGTWAPGAALSVMNGNVGIGTSVASFPIDVYGSSYLLRLNNSSSAQYSGAEFLLANQSTLGNQAGTGIFSGINDAGDTQGYFQIFQANKAGTFVNTILNYNYNSQLWQFYTNANERMRINSAGNVGINATNPLGTLDVEGTLYPVIFNANPGTTNVGIGTTTPQGSFVVTNGNVGIGTWAPNALLDVQGTLQHFYVASSGRLGIGTAAPTSGAITVFSSNPSNNSGIGLYSGVSNSYTSYTIGRTSVDGTFGVAGNAGQWATGTSSGDVVILANQKLILNGTSLLLNTGNTNVGIGSLAPVQRLDVAGTVRATGFTMTGQTPVSGYVLMATDTAGDATWSTAGAVSGWTSSGANIYETNPSGNVGIGSSNPGQALDVQGTVRAVQFMGQVYPWTDVTGTTQSMVSNNSYIADNAALVTLTLPATAAQGDVFYVTGGVSGTGLWKIAQNAGQTIHFGSVNTTTGTSGYLSGSGQYDSVHLVCVKANTDFVVVSSQGNINYN